jgi:chemotaxis signal transduction protein
MMNKLASNSDVIDRQKQLLIFRVGRAHFGIDIDSVDEVFQAGAVTKIPGSREDIAGLMIARGRTITLIDMHATLKLARAEPLPNVVIGLGPGTDYCGLLVDDVEEAVVPNEALKSGDEFEDSDSPLVFAIAQCRVDEKIVTVLNFEIITNLSPATAA